MKLKLVFCYLFLLLTSLFLTFPICMKYSRLEFSEYQRLLTMYRITFFHYLSWKLYQKMLKISYTFFTQILVYFFAQESTYQLTFLLGPEISGDTAMTPFISSYQSIMFSSPLIGFSELPISQKSYIDFCVLSIFLIVHNMI